MTFEKIIPYYLEHQKFLHNDITIKHGYTNLDVFQDKILYILENYIDNTDYFNEIMKSKLSKKRNVRIFEHLNLDELGEMILEKEKEPIRKIKLLFIDYRPEPLKKKNRKK